MFLIKQGELEMTINNKPLTVVCDGDFCGKSLAFSENANYSETLTCISPFCEAFAFEISLFRQLLEEKYPKDKEAFSVSSSDKHFHEARLRINKFFNLVNSQRKDVPGHKGESMVKAEGYSIDLGRTLKAELVTKLEQELKKLASFKRSKELMTQLAQCMKAKVFNSGDYLYVEGEKPAEVAFLCGGTVVLKKGGLDVSVLSNGGCFGEIEVLSNELRITSAYALTQVNVLYLEKEQFDQIFSKFDLELALFKELAHKKRVSLEKVGATLNQRMERLYNKLRDQKKKKSASQRKEGFGKSLKPKQDYTFLSGSGVRASEISMTGSMLKKAAEFKLNEMLRTVEVFRDCSPEFIKDLAENLKPNCYFAGDYIVSEGDVGKEMFFLLEGKVSVMTQGRVIVELTRASFFGESCVLFEDTVRDESVRAETDCDVFVLEKSKLDRILEKYPKQKLGIVSIG